MKKDFFCYLPWLVSFSFQRQHRGSIVFMELVSIIWKISSTLAMMREKMIMISCPMAPISGMD